MASRHAIAFRLALCRPPCSATPETLQRQKAVNSEQGLPSTQLLRMRPRIVRRLVKQNEFGGSVLRLQALWNSRRECH